MLLTSVQVWQKVSSEYLAKIWRKYLNIPVIIFSKFGKHTSLDQLINEGLVLFFRSITNIYVVWLAQFDFVSNIVLYLGR